MGVEKIMIYNCAAVYLVFRVFYMYWFLIVIYS